MYDEWCAVPYDYHRYYVLECCDLVTISIIIIIEMTIGIIIAILIMIILIFRLIIGIVIVIIMRIIIIIKTTTATVRTMYEGYHGFIDYGNGSCYYYYY